MKLEIIICIIEVAPGNAYLMRDDFYSEGRGMRRKYIGILRMHRTTISEQYLKFMSRKVTYKRCSQNQKERS